MRIKREEKRSSSGTELDKKLMLQSVPENQAYFLLKNEFQQFY